MKLVIDDITKDELVILQYVIDTNDGDGFGDPLKDVYELGDDRPNDPYEALKSAARKFRRAVSRVIEEKPEASDG